MKKMYLFITMAICLFVASCGNSSQTRVDVLVVGGGASGVTAGVQAARMGSTALIIEEQEWLGGMLTAAGVSAIDGNYNLPGGLWGEFKAKLVEHYGGLDSLKTGWVSNVQFEPSVGNAILHDLVAAEVNLQVWKQTKLLGVERIGEEWEAEVLAADGTRKNVRAKMLIDATELGDVAKLCGVKYDIGMESRNDTHEDVAPEKANNIVQDLTYVAILKDYGKDVTIPRPEGYNPNDFACACANELCTSPKEPDRVWSKDMMITYGKLPNNKYMINWPIEGNDYYVNLVEMTKEEREEALKAAKQFTMNFVYFIQHELGFNTLGLADDEFPTEDRLAMIPYHRESRRIHGAVRFTLNHITAPYTQEEKLYRTCIAVGDYPVDHHHTRYQGYEELPNLYFHAVPSFGLPLGTLIPQEVEGLIVAEKSISVSNIANGATRLQPVVLQIGQAAGALAALAVQQQKKVDEVAVRDVQNAILDANGYLLPYLDVPVESPLFKPYQRVGSTGILKGEGRNYLWSNQTWLRADTLLLASELDGLTDVYPYMQEETKEATPMTIEVAMALIEKIADREQLDVNVQQRSEQLWSDYGLQNFDPKRNILRGEMAVLIDQILDPFNRKAVDIKGYYVK
ncbi:MAG: FAD-dependent oxidoreductase [Bacteroides sp.]|nr:FAD-dependent oxidoreductase [Bacteroides sp.]